MKDIYQHPVVVYARDFKEICQPLTKLNISYFSHVHIDTAGKFSAASNHPDFHIHYIKNKYHDSDIHVLQNDTFDKYVLWDALDCTGKSQQMNEDAEMFGINHTFTIINKSLQGSDYYHFSTLVNDHYMNQIYLSNLDLLNNFINYFNENVSQSLKLKDAYDFKYDINKKSSGFTFVRNQDIVKLNQIKNRIHFNQENKKILTNVNYNELYEKLSSQQKYCLYYTLQGKTIKEIAKLMSLSPRTVEHYINIIKTKFNCDNKRDLFGMFLEK